MSEYHIYMYFRKFDLFIGTAVHGKTVKICNGHFTPTRKPSDWKDSDCYKIFVSPTIKYSGDDCYAKPERYVAL